MTETSPTESDPTPDGETALDREMETEPPSDATIAPAEALPEEPEAQEPEPGEGGTAETEPRVAATGGGDSVPLQEEIEALNDRHLRLAAEFNNYRRRVESEMSGMWSRAQADLLRRFVDVLDDLSRVSGLDPADEAVSVQSIVEGVDLVERKFIRALEEAGAEVIHAEGEPFNPELMEAMMRVPAPSEEDDDVVAQVFQKGYLLKGLLVRPARVSVFKAE